MKEMTLWAATDIWALWGSEEEQLKMYNDHAIGYKVEMDGEAYDLLESIVTDDWDNMLDAARKINNIAIVGSLGLWNGRHDIIPVKEKDLRSAILRCTRIRGDWTATVYFDKVDYDDDEHLFVSVDHHDGTNIFELKKIMNPKAEEGKWKTKPISQKMILGGIKK